MVINVPVFPCNLAFFLQLLYNPFIVLIFTMQDRKKLLKDKIKRLEDFLLRLDRVEKEASEEEKSYATKRKTTGS